MLIFAYFNEMRNGLHLDGAHFALSFSFTFGEGRDGVLDLSCCFDVISSILTPPKSSPAGRTFKKFNSLQLNKLLYFTANFHKINTFWQVGNVYP